MSSAVPRRITIVWVALVVATAATFVLGVDEPLGTAAGRLGAAVALVIGFAKVVYVGLDFMELRGADRRLQQLFGLWVLVVGGGSLALYLV